MNRLRERYQRRQPTTVGLLPNIPIVWMGFHRSRFDGRAGFDDVPALPLVLGANPFISFILYCSISTACLKCLDRHQASVLDVR